MWDTLLSASITERDNRRAGVPPTSPEIKALLASIWASPAVLLYGFYCHAGDAYGATSFEQASTFLSSEVQMVNAAARVALDMLTEASDPSQRPPPFVLSVGSTPTAHAASGAARDQLHSLLHGTLELHAGERPVALA